MNEDIIEIIMLAVFVGLSLKLTYKLWKNIWEDEN